MTASTEQTCQGHCYGKNPATVTDVWTGQRWCAECASGWRVRTEPLTVQDIAGELREAVTEDAESYTGYQDKAIERIASLFVHQQQRIAALEAAVAKLTGEGS